MTLADEVEQLRAIRLPIVDIAKRLGIRKAKVASIIRERGLRANNNIHTPLNVPKLFRLWNDPTLSVFDIAVELRKSEEHIYRLARRYKLSPVRRCPAKRVDEVPEGEDEASAESLALSPYVQARIRELGIGLHAKATA